MTQKMKGAPEIIIATVLSFLRGRDLGRCACVGKAWRSCAEVAIYEVRRKVYPQPLGL